MDNLDNLDNLKRGIMRKRAKKHNYEKKLEKLRKSGVLPKVGLSQINIAHDDWCGIYKSKRCNCDPDVSLKRGTLDN